jgi:hypothetical protein
MFRQSVIDNLRRTRILMQGWCSFGLNDVMNPSRSLWIESPTADIPVCVLHLTSKMRIAP